MKNSVAIATVTPLPTLIGCFWAAIGFRAFRRKAANRRAKRQQSAKNRVANESPCKRLIRNPWEQRGRPSRGRPK